MDPLYVKDVHSKFGKIKKIESFPHMTVAKQQYVVWKKLSNPQLFNKENDKNKTLSIQNRSGMHPLHHGRHSKRNII